jgi:hypothetical protein
LQDISFDRRAQWQPTPRPEWVAKLNDVFRDLDQAGTVSLDPASLIAQAQANTGLTDFGPGEWRAHFDVLMRAIEEEAQLHFAGRLLTRNEMVLHLQTRLKLIEGYRRFPAIGQEQIAAPVFITGYGRSGTTILFELLAQDPQFRVAERWETMFPYPPPEPESYGHDPRIARTEFQDRLLAEMTPEFQNAHKSGARLPVEALELEYPSFLSDVFPIQFQVPAYAEYLARHGNREAIDWQRTTLKLLQYRMGADRWLMKSPSHLPHLRTMRDIFPDMRVIFTHRDPVATADSIVSIMGTIYWLRTDSPWGKGTIASASLDMADARAEQWAPAMDMIASGALPEGHFANFHYAQFMADPMVAIRGLYRQLGMELAPPTAERMQAYLAARRQGQFGRHTYQAAPPAATDAERRAYKDYIAFFDVARER